jgi:hypothetical protein
MDHILSLFESRSWQELNEIVQNYYHYTSAAEVEKELHPLLLAHNVAHYVQWIATLGRTYKDLSGSTLSKLYHELIRQERAQELRDFLAYFEEEGGFNPGYHSIDALLRSVEKDSPLRGLEQRVNEKIEIALTILRVQLAYNQANEELIQVYTLDTWFDTLAHLAIDRKVKIRFLPVFEEIFIRHYPYVILEHVYESGLFLNVIETYYYGSHLTTRKLWHLFQDFVNGDQFSQQLIRLRDSIVEYRLRTGKFAFPNVKNMRLLLDFYMEK